MSTIPEEEKRRRRQGNDSVMGTMAMSGLFPDAATLSILERFAEGEFTIDEFSAAMDRHAEVLVQEIRVRQAAAQASVETI